MKVFNAVKGLNAAYDNTEGRETITISAPNLNIVEGWAGPANFSLNRVFVLHQYEGSIPATFDQKSTMEGNPVWEIELPERFAPFGFITPDAFRTNLCVPAVILNGVRGFLGDMDYICICPLRSDASTKYQSEFERPGLGVSHDSSTATATIEPNASGGFDSTITIPDDSGYTSAWLTLRRQVSDEPEHQEARPRFQRFLDKMSLEETIGSIAKGTMSFSWRPEVHEFDCVSIFTRVPDTGNATSSPLSAFQEMGVTRGPLGNSLNLICDGPRMDYSLTLKAYRGFSHDEDTMKMSLSQA